MNDHRISTPFSVLHAASLLSQTSRIRKFAEAISRVVTPDTRVVDVGTGSGILAMLAAKAGAAEVVALDINQESVEYAKKAAFMNGLNDRIDFRVCHFADYFPEEKFDVVICEMLSAMLLVEQQIPATRHIWSYVIKKDGVFLPSSVRTYIATVQCDSIWNRFSIQNLLFPMLPQSVAKGQTDDLTDLQELSFFNLSTICDEFMVEKTLKMDIVQDGVAHGIIGVFEASLVDDIRLRMEDGWRELFVPFQRMIDVKSGDVLEVYISYQPGRLDTICIDANL
ncbi:MAG: 50S ribosomal protein L11 methyltransferase [Candidatus Thorarchaeota archaeon]